MSTTLLYQRFGIDGYDVALGEAYGVQAAGYLADDIAVLRPGVSLILWRFLRSSRLVQGEGVRLLPGGFFQNCR